MATVKLADLQFDDQWAGYMIEKSVELNALIKSGIMTKTPEFDELAKGAGNFVNMPFWDDLAGASNVSTDNDASAATPAKVGTGLDITLPFRRNKSWSSMNFSAAFSPDGDPLDYIATRIAEWWNREQQAILIAALSGVLLDNIAADSSDMLEIVGTDGAGAITDAERISAEVINAGEQTMGDHGASLTALAMHSAQYSHLKNLRLVEDVDPAGITAFGRYQGKTIFVDDTLPAVAGSNRILYTSYLFGGGAIGYGEGAPKNPAATAQDEDAGDGAGQGFLYSRRDFIMHPRGVKMLTGGIAGTSPTTAEAALAAMWDRVWDRKHIRIAYIQTNQ